MWWTIQFDKTIQFYNFIELNKSSETQLLQVTNKHGWIHFVDAMGQLPSQSLRAASGMFRCQLHNNWYWQMQSWVAKIYTICSYEEHLSKTLDLGLCQQKQFSQATCSTFTRTRRWKTTITCTRTRLHHQEAWLRMLITEIPPLTQVRLILHYRRRIMEQPMWKFNTIMAALFWCLHLICRLHFINNIWC